MNPVRNESVMNAKSTFKLLQLICFDTSPLSNRKCLDEMGTLMMSGRQNIKSGVIYGNV